MAVIFCAFLSEARNSVVLQPLPGSKPFRFVIPPSDQPYVIEATTNFLNWSSLQTNPASASPVTFTDAQSGNYPRRFYRLQTAGSALSDLSQATNSVFIAGEGFNSVQYAANGKLGFIVWRGPDLVYRERNGTIWTEQTLGAYGATYVAGVFEEYRFQPQAALLFDSQSRAHILRLNGGSVAHHIQQADGHFIQDTPISLASVGSSFSLFSAAIGPGDRLHIALVGSASNAAVSYGSNKGGAWQWSTITSVVGDPRGFLKQSWSPRWFSLAIDSQNNAHLAFCPQFLMGVGPGGYAQPYSQLFYASDRGGGWFTQRVADVADGSGDAGAGASIAIGPGDQPAIAAWYNERYPTGSSLHCTLNYHVRDQNGNWTSNLLVSATAGYVGGDTDNGAGFAPYLRFDSFGRPNIAFCDDAAQHFVTSGQNEYAGDLRHGYFNGTQWVFRTIYAQNSPLHGHERKRNDLHRPRPPHHLAAARLPCRRLHLSLLLRASGLAAIIPGESPQITSDTAVRHEARVRQCGSDHKRCARELPSFPRHSRTAGQIESLQL
jgi:hypothetical protein